MRYVAPVSPSQHAPCFQLPFLFALLFLSWGGLLPPALYAQEQLLEGFEETEVVSGISSPSGFRFSPDGRLFIYERIHGTLRIAHFNESLRTWELEPVSLLHVRYSKRKWESQPASLIRTEGRRIRP